VALAHQGTAAALASGATDVGIASVAAFSNAVEQFPFRDDRLVVVLPRGGAATRRGKLALVDVVDRAFVGLLRHSALQRNLAGHAARLGTTMRVRTRVSGSTPSAAWSSGAAGSELCRRIRQDAVSEP
jgi:hypothetical protein